MWTSVRREQLDCDHRWFHTFIFKTDSTRSHSRRLYLSVPQPFDWQLISSDMSFYARPGADNSQWEIVQTSDPLALTPPSWDTHTPANEISDPVTYIFYQLFKHSNDARLCSFMTVVDSFIHTKLLSVSTELDSPVILSQTAECFLSCVQCSFPVMLLLTVNLLTVWLCWSAGRFLHYLALLDLV